MRERDETAGGSETAPEHLLLPGRVLVASDGDSFVDLRVSSPPAEGVLTARARRGALSAGRALHARTWDGSRAWRLGLTVESVSEAPDGDLVVARVGTVAIGADERTELRTPFVTGGTVRSVGAAELAATPIEVRDIAICGVSFSCTRRHIPGEALELEIEHPSGGVLRCRVAVARWDEAPGGRSLTAARITGISELHERRLANMLARGA